MRKLGNEKGFSLIELLIVVVIIGVIAAIGVPLMSKGIIGAENGAIFATTKIMVQEQFNFYATNGRYARLDEINQKFGNGFGTTQGNDVLKGKYTFSMGPSVPSGAVPPSNEELKENFNILATRTIDNTEVPYLISVDASGEIIQILP